MCTRLYLNHGAHMPLYTQLRAATRLGILIDQSEFARSAALKPRTHNSSPSLPCCQKQIACTACSYRHTPAWAEPGKILGKNPERNNKKAGGWLPLVFAGKSQRAGHHDECTHTVCNDARRVPQSRQATLVKPRADGYSFLRRVSVASESSHQQGLGVIGHAIHETTLESHSSNCCLPAKPWITCGTPKAFRRLRVLQLLTSLWHAEFARIGALPLAVTQWHAGLARQRRTRTRVIVWRLLLQTHLTMLSDWQRRNHAG